MWAASGGQCGKYLKESMPLLLDLLEASGELDDDVVASEPLDHSTESGLGSTDTRTIQCSPNRALATARQDHPVACVAGQPVDVVAQQPLLTTGHVGVGNDS